MRDLFFVMLGFVALVLQSALGVMLPPGSWAPNPLLPVVLYLGVSPDVPTPRGAFIAFMLGFLADSFSGSPIGLFTFVLVASFLVARGAGLSLFMRGPWFQMLVTLAFALLSGGCVLALRAIFEPPAPFPTEDGFLSFGRLSASALMTALLSPGIFWVVRRVDTALQRGREEGGSP